MYIRTSNLNRIGPYYHFFFLRFCLQLICCSGFINNMLLHFPSAQAPHAGYIIIIIKINYNTGA